MKKTLSVIMLVCLLMVNVCRAEIDSTDPLSAIQKWKEAVANCSVDDLFDCFVTGAFVSNRLGENTAIEFDYYQYRNVNFFRDDSYILKQEGNYALLYFGPCFSAETSDSEYPRLSKNYSTSVYAQFANGEWKLAHLADKPYCSTQNMENSTVYIKSKWDICFPTDVLSLEYGAWSKYSVDDHAFANPFARVAPYPILDRSNGDILITTGSSSQYTLRRVDDIQYCYPALLKEEYAYRPDETGKNQLTVVGLQWVHSFMPVSTPSSSKGIAEVNGYEVIDCDDLKQIVHNRGITVNDFSDSGVYGLLLTSDAPVGLTIGYFNGTKFQEENIQLDYSLYTLGNEYKCPVQTTKNGYFIIDTSSLPAGYYVIEDGYNWYSLNLIQICD